MVQGVENGEIRVSQAVAQGGGARGGGEEKGMKSAVSSFLAGRPLTLPRRRGKHASTDSHG